MGWSGSRGGGKAEGVWGGGLGDEAKKRGAEPRNLGLGGEGFRVLDSGPAAARAMFLFTGGGCLTGGPQRL